MVPSLREHYVLPTRVVHIGVLALIVLLLLNCSETILHGTYMWRTWNNKTPTKLPITPRTVALKVVDSERYGMHDDNDWASVFPFGHGFVKVGDHDEFFAVSMYHQMHCLNGFRKMFNGNHNASRTEHDAFHTLHCLSYLRQMVLCSADITLEPAFLAQNINGKPTQAAYGAGVTHECRDWVQVRQFAEENYAVWKDELKGFAVTEATVML